MYEHSIFIDEIYLDKNIVNLYLVPVGRHIYSK